jgi:hypothetical protein
MHQNIYYCIIFFLTTVPPIYGQSSDKNKFTEAESFFLYEEYLDALPLYLDLKNTHPDNYNIDYKIGRCYLYIPYQKDRAIKYLLRSSKNIDPDYKGKSIKETKAPTDALYYLGRAYHIQNQLDDAIATYKEFLEILDEKEYNPDLVKHQIEACKIAAKAFGNPVDLKFTNIGKPINDRFSQNNAVVSGNGKTLAYTSKLQFYDAVFISTKNDEAWSSPRNIIPELKVDDKIYPTGLSYDGKELYLYKLDDYDGNIYVSRMKNNQWTPPVKLNDNINTKYWESHASVSKDGKTLFFTSNRPGGYGDLDIYFSQRANGSDWGEPVNAGNTINSNQNEDYPFITGDGERLYFSSLGHETMGGYDIFYVEKQNANQWGAPVNMGYPVNTTDDNLFYQPTDNGNAAIFSLIRKDGYGLFDIYKLDLTLPDEPAQISLHVQINDGGKTGPFQGKIITPQTGKIIDSTNIETGEKDFSTSVAPGNYMVMVNGENVITKEKIETTVRETVPADPLTNMKLIINDLIDISTNSDLTHILKKLSNDLNSYSSIDDIYDKLVLLADDNHYTIADVDRLMERYLLSLLRYFEEQVVKKLLTGKISYNEEKGAQENIHAAFADLENIIYTIARLATYANIPPSQILSFLESIGDQELTEPVPETNSEAGIYNWLERIFANEQLFHSDTETRAAAISLLEIMILSEHMDKVYQAGSESLKKFYISMNVSELKNILNYKNSLTKGIKQKKTSYNDIINAFLTVNKNIDILPESLPVSEPLATHQASGTNNAFSIAMYGAGGILLIFIIVFYIRRRRKTPST